MGESSAERAIFNAADGTLQQIKEFVTSDVDHDVTAIILATTLPRGLWDSMCGQVRDAVRREMT